ncbi:hypothetical protein BKA60DRAFT_548773 [Fusarium oxysporum]|nr:hypothetical protein BKA60DRAFT_548773 [Fusarium oxysporum]
MTASNRVLLRRLGSRKLIPLSLTLLIRATPSATTPPLQSKEYLFGALERNVRIRIDLRRRTTLVISKMAEKDRKVGASAIENSPPSIADLGKPFDEIAQERLERRDPTSRRWQRKT